MMSEDLATTRRPGDQKLIDAAWSQVASVTQFVARMPGSLDFPGYRVLEEIHRSGAGRGLQGPAGIHTALHFVTSCLHSGSDEFSPIGPGQPGPPGPKCPFS